MLAHAASGPSCSCDASAAVDGEESAKAALCQGEGKDEPHDDIMIASDVPTNISKTARAYCLLIVLIFT